MNSNINTILANRLIWYWWHPTYPFEPLECYSMKDVYCSYDNYQSMLKYNCFRPQIFFRHFKKYGY